MYIVHVYKISYASARYCNYVRFWFKIFNDKLEKCTHTYKNVI